MSKEKSAQQKKASSLKHDRRNTYGESPQASRKNIARAKQRSHQRERHAVSQELNALSVVPADEDLVLATENSVKTTERLLKVKGFKKVPDDSLGQVLKGRHDREKPFQRRLMDNNLGRPEDPPTPPKPKLRSRIMYIECKAEGLTGLARIGRVFFSKRGGTLYCNGRATRVDIAGRSHGGVDAPHAQDYEKSDKGNGGWTKVGKTRKATPGEVQAVKGAPDTGRKKN